MANLKELEDELRAIRLERQIKEERAKTSSDVKRVKKQIKKSTKPKKKLGFFAPRGNEKEGLDFLMGT